MPVTLILVTAVIKRRGETFKFIYRGKGYDFRAIRPLTLIRPGGLLRPPLAKKLNNFKNVQIMGTKLIKFY